MLRLQWSRRFLSTPKKCFLYRSQSQKPVLFVYLSLILYILILSVIGELYECNLYFVHTQTIYTTFECIAAKSTHHFWLRIMFFSSSFVELFTFSYLLGFLDVCLFTSYVRVLISISACAMQAWCLPNC